MTDAIWLLIGFMVFPAPIPAIAFLFLTFGDPAASILGRMFGRICIDNKSLEGIVSYFLVSALVAVVLWQVGAITVLWPALAGALVAALVELLPLKVDDNFSVPLLTSGTMWLLWMVYTKNEKRHKQRGFFRKRCVWNPPCT